MTKGVEFEWDHAAVNHCKSGANPNSSQQLRSRCLCGFFLLSFSVSILLDSFLVPQQQNALGSQPT